MANICLRVNMAATTSSEKEIVNEMSKDSPNNQEKIEEHAESKGATAVNSGMAIKTPLSGMEEQFLGKFMSPMFAKMEEAVQKNTKILDDIQKDLDIERNERRKRDSSKHIPDTIKEYGQDIKDIMSHLEKLVLYENYDENAEEEGQVKAHLKTLDVNSEVMLLAHSIAAYVSTLETSHLKYLANKMVTDTTLWLSKLFRMSDASAYFHGEEREGLVRICRLALHKRYPEYVSEGFMALQSSAPVIYISAASRPGMGMHICTQLGLPVSCICTVPLYLNTHKMDVVALERLMKEDKEAGKTPLMVIAYAGTPVLGHVDDLPRIQGLCSNNQVWLHIEGNSVALLTWFTVPTNVRPVTSGDSLAINLGGWLGLPAVPYVTLYKTPEDIQLARAAGLTYYNAKYKLSCMPVWVCLQNLGHYGIVEKIEYSVNLARKAHTKVNELENLRNVSKNRKMEPQPQGEVPMSNDHREGNLNVLGKYMLKVVSALTLCEIENPTVVFRYVKAEDNPDNQEETEQAPKKEDAAKPEAEEESGDSGEESEEEEEDVRNPYFDALNIWLCETLKRECPKVHIAAIEIANEGVCIRFAPMESIHDYDTTEEEVDEFVDTLENQLSILDATVRQREVFSRVVAARANLRSITLPNWAGLGAVLYVPETELEKMDSGELDEATRAELNKINYELVHQLKSQDTAFSLGHSPDKLFCVRFGLVTDDTDLEELIELVFSTGKQVEESSKYLDTMAEVIREGIVKAEHDLEKENQDKLAQEGALRQLPVVGSLLNWFSPPPKDPIKGRTFSLQSGTVQSTEETYKYHMQVQKEAQAQNNSTQRVRTMSGQSQASNTSSVVKPEDPPATQTSAPQDPAATEPVQEAEKANKEEVDLK